MLVGVLRVRVVGEGVRVAGVCAGPFCVKFERVRKNSLTGGGLYDTCILINKSD